MFHGSQLSLPCGPLNGTHTSQAACAVWSLPSTSVVPVNQKVANTGNASSRARGDATRETRTRRTSIYVSPKVAIEPATVGNECAWDCGSSRLCVARAHGRDVGTQSASGGEAGIACPACSSADAHVAGPGRKQKQAKRAEELRSARQIDGRLQYVRGAAASWERCGVRKAKGGGPRQRVSDTHHRQPSNFKSSDATLSGVVPRNATTQEGRAGLRKR